MIEIANRSQAINDSGKFVLLDRDGVINRDLPQSVRSVNDFELLPGVAEAIERMTSAGYQIIVITNQACVGRGDLSAGVLEQIHDRLLDEVSASGGVILDIFVCPHTDADECNCRKPKPGLVLQAADRYSIDLAETWFVGDAPRDVEAAFAAGCRPALVRSGKPLDANIPAGIPMFDDLGRFALALVREQTS